jgi:hypothetical protein
MLACLPQDWNHDTVDIIQRHSSLHFIRYIKVNRLIVSLFTLLYILLVLP